MNDKIREVNFKKPSKIVVDMREALENMRAMIEYSAELATLNARYYKERYDAFIVEGFTEQQALDLIIGGK